MAKDQFSFDVVSEVDLQEVHNAFDQARREIQTRFDFKNTGTEIALDENLIELRSETDHRIKAAAEVIKDKLVRRSISLKALSEGPILPAARGTVKQSLHINQGIDDEKARAINKAIKGAGLKVQTQIQKNQLRVSGKSKDELQAVQRVLKDSDFGIPLQFTNYRP